MELIELLGALNHRYQYASFVDCEQVFELTRVAVEVKVIVRVAMALVLESSLL